MDNPCVICGELGEEHFAAEIWAEIGTGPQGERILKAEEAKTKLQDHKRICNVGRQYRWLMN